MYQISENLEKFRLWDQFVQKNVYHKKFEKTNIKII